LGKGDRQKGTWQRRQAQKRPSLTNKKIEDESKENREKGKKNRNGK